MTAHRADDREDGYLAGDLAEAPTPPEPRRGASDGSPDHYPEGDPNALYEQDLPYHADNGYADDDHAADGHEVDDAAVATPRERYASAAICAGLCAAAVAAGVAWLIVRSRRRVHPVRRAAGRLSERSRRVAAEGRELVEPLEGHARRGVANSVQAASRLRRRAETLRRR